MQLKSLKFSAKQFMLLPLTSPTNINNLKHPAIDGTGIQKEDATSLSSNRGAKATEVTSGFGRLMDPYEGLRVWDIEKPP